MNKQIYKLSILFIYNKTRVIKYFDTIDECEGYLNKNEDEIVSAQRQMIFAKNKNKKEKPSDGFYDPTRNWTDEEMDLYL